jgi:hypothetical protein
MHQHATVDTALTVSKSCSSHRTMEEKGCIQQLIHISSSYLISAASDRFSFFMVNKRHSLGLAMWVAEITPVKCSLKGQKSFTTGFALDRQVSLLTCLERHNL